MAYLSPIHPASSVRHALDINFLDPEKSCLAVAKANRIEIYEQAEEGLILRHSKAVFGKVIMLSKIKPDDSMTEHLFVGTDRSTYFTVSWDPATMQLQTEKSKVDISDGSSRETQTQSRCNIDPERRFMTLELYEGIITVVPVARKRRKDSPVELGNIEDPVSTRIPEMFVKSSAFLHRRQDDTNKEPKLALLHTDTQKRTNLQIRQLNYTPGLHEGDGGHVELEEISTSKEELGLGASLLIPVPAPIGGLLILDEVMIMYYDERTEKYKRSPLSEATVWKCWTQIDGQRFVLADEYGKLYLLMIELSSNQKVRNWTLDVIGEASQASTLVYLGAGRLYLGSHTGDSQVLEIKPKSIETIQVLPNIAPIVDFAIMDMGNRSREGPTNEFSSGQARLVTGSGAFGDGSLRSLRSGVGLEEIGLLGEITNVSDVFSLKSAPASQYCDILLVSFVDETRAFKFDPSGDVEEIPSLGGFTMSEGTLYAANVSGGKLIQITRSAVRLLDTEGGMLTAEWKAPSGSSITTFAANEESIVVCVAGLKLAFLDIKQGLSARGEKTYDTHSQIACLTLSSLDTYTACIVGFWQNSSISQLRLPDLSDVRTTAINDADEVAVPRGLLVAKVLEGFPTLFIALADGNVVNYRLNPRDGSLNDRKNTILGTQPVTLRALPRDGGWENVFAICENPSLIYGSEGRLVFSATTAEDATCVCPFNAECYPGAIAIASKSDLKIAMVDEKRSTHVQGVKFGETVRRIAYSSELKMFGLGTIHRKLEDQAEVVTSHLKLVDEVMFQTLATYELMPNELAESVMRAQLPDGKGGLAERFVLGTSHLEENPEEENIRGRIIVFEVTEDRQLKVLVEHATKGACRCLSVIDGKIVAALTKAVVLFNLEYETRASPFLVKTGSYRTATAPIDLAVSSGDNTIGVSDLMKSLSVINYARGHAGGRDTLKEIARHYNTVWSTAVARIDQGRYLESDSEGNLFVLEQNEKGVTEYDKRRMIQTSSMCLGEMVNKIRVVNVSTSEDAAVVPRAFLATVEGGVHLFSTIQPQFLNVLIPLQQEMAHHIESPGNIPFGTYRGVRTRIDHDPEPERFVDGELVEQFLECDEVKQSAIVQGMNIGSYWTVERLCEVLEALRRLR